MVENPFNCSVPVRPAGFINREKIIKEILNITVKRKTKEDVWLVGARQIGKTSLLQNIEYLYKNETDLGLIDKKSTIVIIYSNLQKLRSRNDFYDNLTQKLIEEFDFKLEEESDSYRMFLTWIKEVYNKNFYIVFLLDEFDAFLQKLCKQSEIEAVHFLDELNVDKAGMQEIGNRPKVFSFVFSSNHTSGELTKNLDLDGSGLIVNKIIELSFFTQNQVTNLAHHYLKDTGIHFNDDEIKLCFSVTNGYPLFVQLFFSDLFDKRSEEANNFSPQFYSNIKKQYQETAKKLAIDWHSRKNMPATTFSKIKKLFKGLGITLEIDIPGVKLTFKKDIP